MPAPVAPFRSVAGSTVGSAARAEHERATVKGWTARARLTWAGVVATAAVVLVWAVAAAAASRPLTPQEWLILAALTVATILLTLRPAELGADWKVSAASLPALALAVLFPPSWATLAGGGAMAVGQWLARRPWYA
ncbi:MAG: hypothetical protein ACRDJN_23015, partial [Chloroflexota bacterium]